jgi:hypothetical protein
VKCKKEVIETVFKINEIVDNTPKLSPLKTVPIGVASEQTKISDKELLERLANQITIVSYPTCESKEAKQHVEFIINMLNKLAAQTHKVAEKL